MAWPNILNQIFHRNKLSLKHVLALFSFIFVVWAVYRYFPEILPHWFQELVLKPLIWLVPTFWLVTQVEREKLASLGFTSRNLARSLQWGVGLGIIFALQGFLANMLKYRGLRLISLDYDGGEFLVLLAISLVTALSEETVFRGYIFTRLSRIWKSEWSANLVSALLFSLIYLPLTVFVMGYRPLMMAGYLFFVFLYGVASAFIFARTKNLVSSILLHAFWSWPILLFR